MALQNIGEFHCDVCFEIFGENFKCPRMLTCGHSFCHSCLENLIVQSPTCPNCKQGIHFPNVDCIPVNYIVKSIVSRFNVVNQASLNEQNTILNTSLSSELKEESMDSITLKNEMPSQELPYEGYCEDHHLCKHLRCMDCKCWVCGVCATLNHKPCRTLLVTEALKEMKKEISKEVEAEIEVQNSQHKCLDIYLKDFEWKRSFLKIEIKKLQFELRNKIETLNSFGKKIEQLQLIKSEIKKHCEKLKAMEIKVVATSTDDHFMKATSKLNNFLDQSRKLMEELNIPKHWYGHLTIELLQDWCQEGSVYASRCQNGTNQYGQVKVIGNRVWVHRFQPKRPQTNDAIISVEDETLGLKDVVIATDALTPRAMNFLLRCSGIKGRSYEGVKLLGRGSCITTPLKGGAVVKGIKDGGVYEAPAKKGFVGGCEADTKDSLSRFFICMKDDPSSKFIGKFGFVEEGLDLCEGIYENKSKGLLIKHCGLVI